MHHTLAFEGSVAQTADTDIAAVYDEIIPIDLAGHPLPQQDLNLIYAYCSSANLLRGRFTSPILRQIANPAVRPINKALLPVDLTPVADYRDNPLNLPALAPIQYFATSGLACGNEVTYAVMGFLTQYMAPAQGRVITLRATGTTTVTAKQWTSVQLTFDQSIISGTYQLLGAEVFGATAIAFRFVVDNQFWRPGGIAALNTSYRTWPMQMKGRLGVWGQFVNTSPPRLEILCNAADTAQEVYLDVIKIA